MDSINPYSAPETEAVGGQAGFDTGIIEPLIRVSGWMMFMGVLMIILGAFGMLGGLGVMFVGGEMALVSLIYFVVSGLFIMMGVWFCQASGRLKPMHLNSPTMLREGVTKLASVIRMQGIFMLVYLLLIVVVVLFGVMGAAMFANAR